MMSANTPPTTVELEATAMRYFSEGDESAFFSWLDRLPFVEGYEGQGKTLYIRVNTAEVDEIGLREMLALFRRYRIGLRQLACFDREEFAGWFRNEQAYWYREVFG